MKDSFAALEKEKREKIINAAMLEFAQRGYDRASTNEIVKRAEISKGLLFHYFRTKKVLFLFLYDHAIKVMREDFHRRIDPLEGDFFKKMRQVLAIKLEILKRYPELFKFAQLAYLETSSEIKEDLEKRNKKLIGLSTQQIVGQSDVSGFHEAIDLKQGLNIITWSMEGLLNQAYNESRLKKRSIDYKKLLADAEGLIATFERLFIKEGH